MRESFRSDPAIWAALIDRANEILLVFDVDSATVFDVNEAGADRLGYSRAELRGRSVTEVAGFETETAFRAHLPSADSDSHLGENVLRGADGHPLPVEASVTRLTHDGRDLALVDARDISDRRAVEQELERQRGRARQFFETAGNIMVVLNRDGSVERINDRGCELLGYSRERIEGADWFDLVVPEDLEVEVGSLFEEFATGTVEGVSEHTNDVLESDGSRRHVRWRNTPLKSPDGEITGILSSGVDITDRKQIEDTLQAQRDDLQLLNQLVRHDIRNDLQLVHAYAEILVDRLDGEPRMFAETIEARSQSTIRLTETARELATAMIERENGLEAVPLRETLRGAIEDARSAYGEAVIEVPEPVPQIDVAADELLGSVFWNLLQNAITHNDAATPRVQVRTTLAGQQAVVRIADNGPGIPDDRKAAIFEPGESGGGGSGLGLHLVDYLVGRYDGTVRIEDAVELGGAAFRLELPLA